ncbi:hypothetical protein MHH33_09025 [Paenisporosarcina sp. FSL H8-0542]|uniref:hypothetical protein n=1 Tax=Paenisporosarcina sp. FSL H8-0542 TaxID=2921401 RepID=UPI00315B20A6
MKRNIALVGTLGCMLLGGIWIHHQHQEIVVASTVKSEKEQSDEVLIQNTRMLSKQITTQLKKEQILDIAGISINHQSKDIGVRVNGTPQYLNKVENDIKRIVEMLAEETIFKDYAIGAYIQITNDNKAELDQMGQLSKLINTIQEDLKGKGFVEIENVLIEKNYKMLIVVINTTIQKNDSASIDRGKEIEKEVKGALKEVKSSLITETVTVQVIVNNFSRKKIN